jgi:hypothetical protein
VAESVLDKMLDRIRVESETKTNVEITAYEALVLDAKLFELKQLVDDQRRLIDFLRVDEKAKERAAVVAWLRDCALDPETTGAEMRLFQNQATTIERGDHVKGVTDGTP